VLTTSAGFADLEQQSLLAVGAVTIHGPRAVPLQQLIGIYGSSFSSHGGSLLADLPEEALQIAIGMEAEAAADRFVRQVATYESLLQTSGDPLWTAVTGYYAGFFAANALMLGVGRGLLRVDPTTVTVAQSGGLHRVEVAPGGSVGHLSLRLTPVSGYGSHVATWAAVRDLLTVLGATAGNGAREAQTFVALGALIVGPPWLSRERNDMNYDFRRNPFLAGFWSRELPDLTGENAVASRILSVLSPRPEQRFELVMAGCASLFFGLSRRFVARGGRLDPQRRATRRRVMGACPSLEWLVG
jgi:hypothetical protein